MNRASVSCDTTSGGLTGVQVESSNFYWQGEGRRIEKNLCRNNGQNFPKFDENYKLTNQRSSVDPKYNKYEEKSPGNTIIKLFS